MLKNCLPFIGAFILLQYSFAQNNLIKEPGMPSPTAASLGKYGDIPVSHHTGVPNISIPLYTLVEGNLQIPITLNYHSSGIKVEETASWVGLGWSLSAGGVITRTRMGAMDDKPGRGWYDIPGFQIGFLNPVCDQPGAYDDNYVQATPNKSCADYYGDAAEGINDTEPDVFNFNFSGYSGKFFFDDNRIPHIQPEQDIKIEPTYTSNGFEAWKITTPDGTKYYFGGSGATEKGYTDNTGIGAATDNTASTTSWYLTKIESINNNHSVYFSYESERYSYAIRNTHTYTYTEVVSQGVTSCFPVSGNLEIAPEVAGVTLIDGYRLSQITTSSGNTSIELNANTIREDLSSYTNKANINTEAKRLDELVIYSGDWEKKYDFNYSYFTSTIGSSAYDYTTVFTHHADTYRLKLESLTESGREGLGTFTSKPSHQFNYDETYTMARRLSLARDHWGYYNGHDNNQGLLPSNITVCTTTYSGADRDPDEQKMKTWILEKITYPTGGYSEFVYEPHKENNALPNITGGLRIKQINTLESIGSTPIARNYTYSSGLLYAGAINYKQNPKNNPQGLNFDFDILLTSTPQAPLRHTQGYHIGYSVVHEEMTNNGKTTYRYFNTQPTQSIYPFPAAPTQYQIGTGILFAEEHRDENGTLLRSTTNSYLTELGDPIHAIKLVKASCNTCSSPVLILAKDYYIQTGRHLIQNTTTVADGVTTITNYDYSNLHNSPTETTVTNSDDQEHKTEIDYHFDWYVSTCQYDISGCLNTYINTINPAWNDYLACGTDSICKLDKIAIYNSVMASAENQYITCKSAQLLQHSNCIQNELANLQSSDTTKFEMLMRYLNAPLEIRNYTDNTQIGGSQVVYLKDSYQNLIATENYAFLPQSAQWERKLQVGYDAQAKAVEFQREDDQPANYVWGRGGNVSTAKTVNAYADQTAYTSFEVKSVSEEDQGRWTINETPQVDNISSNPSVAIGITVDQATPEFFSYDDSDIQVSISNLTAGATVTLSYTNLETGATNTWQFHAGGQTPSKNFAPGRYSFTFTSAQSSVSFNYSYTNSRYIYPGFENSETGKTGHHCFELQSGNSITKSNLPVGEYLLSYWQKGGSVQVATAGASITATQTHEGVNGWELVMQTMNVPATGGQVTLSGSQVFIDELRLHPIDAQMVTFCYDSALRLITQSDLNHVSVYYEYDDLGRLTAIRDQDGKLVQTTEYKYQTE